jgi:hypothetical protein
MEKKTVFALLTVLILGVGAAITLRTPEKGERVGPPPRPIPIMKAAEIARLELTSEKQSKVVLERSGETWRIKAPNDWPADLQAVKAITDALEKVSFGSQVTESTDKHEDLGVKEGHAPRITAFAASGRLCDLFVGKSVSGYTMVRPADKNDVWQMNGLSSYQLNKEPKDWRDHTIFSFPVGDATRLSVEASGSKLVVERDASKGDKVDAGKTTTNAAQWKVAEATGTAPKALAQLDQAQIQGAVSALANLRANDFADEKKVEEVGLDKPILTLTATTPSGQHRLLIGHTHGDDTYVKAEAAPTVYLLKPYAIERLAHPPRDYADKTLVKAKEVELNRIEVLQGADSTILERVGDQWKLKGAQVDDTKLKPFVAAFGNLQGSGFSDNKDLKKNGLWKPKATLTVELKDKSKIILKIGATERDNYYVQKSGSPDLFLAKKYQIDRILKKPSDFSSPSTAKK